jgi:hypothetical protein
MSGSHCEEQSDAAIQEHGLDCFATLAMTRASLSIALVLCVSACRDRQPPAPSAEQSAQLNEAEDMLNAEAAKEKGPEANAPGPSNSSD